jgi:hypothetical protein
MNKIKIKKKKKNVSSGQVPLLTTVILATQEAEMKRVVI